MKIGDIPALILTMIIASPFIILTILVLTIGYPLHVVKEFITKKVPRR